jgi:hypothetical protein
MKFFYYIWRFWEISQLERKLFLKGFFLSMKLHLLIRYFPVKYYYNYLNIRPEWFASETNSHNYIQLIKRTLRRLHKISYPKLSCLNESLIGKSLGAYLGIETTIKLIINENNGSFSNAHAILKFKDRYMIADSYLTSSVLLLLKRCQ